jgi:predicted ATPase
MDGAADGSAAAARFAAVVRASEGLLSAAKASGFVVILEDLHWADDATLQLLRYLVNAELSTYPLLIIGTSRDPLPDGLAGLTGAWIQRLDPLTVAEVAQYLGPGVHQSWPVAVHRRSAGNALFVSELSRLLQPSDMTEPTDGAWKVPTDLVRLISARLNQLPDRCRELLDGASAAGEEFDLGMLAIDSGAVMETVAAGVLIEEPSVDRFRWSHAVVRDAWYDRPPRDYRLHWHRRIADELSRRGVEQVFEVAAHRLRSAADEQSRRAAVRACQSAAAAATRSLCTRRSKCYARQTSPRRPPRIKAQGAMGKKPLDQVTAGRTTPAEDSGTAFHAPGRSPSGSDTTSRVSRPSRASLRSASTSVEK